MEFILNNLYLCIKDVIAINNNQLAFKRGSVYKCIEENTLLGNNNVAYNIKICVKDYEHYFKPIINEDNVNHPSHYTQGKIECIDAMESAYGTEAVIMFCMCNAFKYQWRFNKKNGREDILKCQWYQNKMVELQNKLNNKDKNI